MEYYKITDDLQHHGVKGMKWGVVKKVYKVGSKVYSAAKKHGEKTLNKQAKRSDFRSQYHASKGHKLRSKYYDNKAFRTRDKTFDDKETVAAAIKDLSIKSEAVLAAAAVGATVVKGVIKHLGVLHEDRVQRKVFDAVNKEMLDMLTKK